MRQAVSDELFAIWVVAHGEDGRGMAAVTPCCEPDGMPPTYGPPGCYKDTRDDVTHYAQCAGQVVRSGWLEAPGGRWRFVEACAEHAELLRDRLPPGSVRVL